MRTDLLFEAVGGKRLLTGQAFIQHTGEGVHVGARIELAGGDAFGCQVRPGANDVAGVGQAGLIGGTGDAEVDQVGEVLIVQEHVGGFDVAVYQPDPVCRVQCRGDLLDDADRPRRVQWTLPQTCCRS